MAAPFCLNMKKIIKIVLTGGVCSGKTTALPILKDYLKDKYDCLIVPETATTLVENGFDPRREGDYYSFQKAILLHQIETEAQYEKTAQTCDSNTVIILLDRGAVDAFAYLDEVTAARLMLETELSKQQLLDRYDAVIHMVTTADGAPDFYTTANNDARIESPEEAIETDRRTLSAWQEHPMHFVVDNSGNFDHKMERVKKFINDVLKL